MSNCALFGKIQFQNYNYTDRTGRKSQKSSVHPERANLNETSFTGEMI